MGAILWPLLPLELPLASTPRVCKSIRVGEQATTFAVLSYQDHHSFCRCYLFGDSILGKMIETKRSSVIPEASPLCKSIIRDKAFRISLLVKLFELYGTFTENLLKQSPMLNNIAKNKFLLSNSPSWLFP